MRPTTAALRASPSGPVALIAGGLDRRIGYRPLAQSLVAGDAATRVFALPPGGDRIRSAIAAEATGRVESFRCADLHGANVAAFSWARPDGAVLLSPAALSFGPFRDFRERAAAFASAMRTCD